MHYTIQQALQAAIPLLQQAGIESPRLEADILLTQVLGVQRSYLIAWSNRQLSTTQYDYFHQLISRRQQGEPIAYLTGHREFWSLDLLVSPAVLIPRPATESLVEQALKHLVTITTPMIADLGTGSGAIALALARECPAAQVFAIDREPIALAVAQANAHRLKIDNVFFICASWLQALLPHSMDMLVSNPPYIAENDVHLTQGDIRFEPITALTAGIDGLVDIRHLVQYGQQYLKPKGWLLLEHGYNQGQAVRELMQQNGFCGVTTIVDLEEQERVTLGQTA
ncbi:peptide chain release factor N(5)-glutamine methyltransferase [Beggiatoa leptomitoformis]|uniref:Release factor glutamine methyltransferase n=1 Tax=Beggiatoa leptomitoformis TaxID=288004 RepID=A0A2N9YFW3_9GAMM|nr:peptide chain release factor N(5)-glutamine methyltransferase [Beggiatoa leptomitoformis]ALG68242.1 peptide chain release factor N(5)-glutamine methyltransferase [Beggiatoa leptomitoformis]AUI69451.1 peptide chain release factor N(5)-glutamine methyltransferase [Beggiatoa leptomitoformis]